MAEFFALIFAVCAHEFGHFAAAKLCSVPCLGFGFRTGGAVLTFDFTHVGFAREGLVHASGAIFGLFSAIVAWLIFGENAYFYLGITLVLSAVNLLPIIGLDGGAILSCLLSEIFLPDTVWRVQRFVSLAAALFLWGAVLWIELRVMPNFGLLAFALCVILGSFR